MAIDTYTTLQTAIENRLGRSDLDAEIPDFIALAEAVFNRELRTLPQEAIATATATQYTSLPNDCEELRRLHLQGTPTTELLPVAPELANNYSGATGRPLYYIVTGSTAQLIPAPDATYTVEFVYYQTIPPLASNSTNWLLTAWPDLYVYASLFHAYVRIQDTASAERYAALMQGLLADVRKSDRRFRWSGGPMATRAA